MAKIMLMQQPVEEMTDKSNPFNYTTQMNCNIRQLLNHRKFRSLRALNMQLTKF